MRSAYAPPGGDLAGLAIPARNADGPVAAYLGVVPELRGNGYVDDLLAEITHLLAAGGSAVNPGRHRPGEPADGHRVPAGDRNFAVRMVLSAPIYSA